MRIFLIGKRSVDVQLLRAAHCFIVNCSSIVPQAIPTNTRAACADVMEKAKAHEPWFGIEQVMPRA